MLTEGKLLPPSTYLFPNRSIQMLQVTVAEGDPETNGFTHLAFPNTMFSIELVT